MVLSRRGGFRRVFNRSRAVQSSKCVNSLTRALVRKKMARARSLTPSEMVRSHAYVISLFEWSTFIVHSSHVDRWRSEGGNIYIPRNVYILYIYHLRRILTRIQTKMYTNTHAYRYTSIAVRDLMCPFSGTRFTYVVNFISRFTHWWFRFQVWN